MSKAYYSLGDGELLAWSKTLSEHLTATPDAFRVTAEQAAIYAALQADFAAALAVWRDNTTRTPVASEGKKFARKNLLDGTRHVVWTINTNPLTDDAQRQELGIPLRKRASPIEPPATPPTVEVAATSGRTVTFRLRTPGRLRARPAGASGASVFVHLGPEAPADAAGWAFEALVTKSTFSLSFENRLASDAVWITCFWYTERGGAGKASRPICVRLPAAVALPSGATDLRIAA